MTTKQTDSLRPKQSVMKDNNISTFIFIILLGTELYNATGAWSHISNPYLSSSLYWWKNLMKENNDFLNSGFLNSKGKENSLIWAVLMSSVLWICMFFFSTYIPNTCNWSFTVHGTSNKLQSTHSDTTHLNAFPACIHCNRFVVQLNVSINAILQNS